MVEDDAGRVAACGCIGPVVDILLLSATATQKAYDDVVAVFGRQCEIA